MRKFGLIALSGIVAVSAFATGVFAQDATPESESMEMMSDTAYVRVAYVVPDAPAVDLYVNTEGLDALVPADAIAEGLGVLLATAEPNTITDFIAAPAGSYEVTITAAGDTTGVVGPLAVDLAGGLYLTVVVSGSVANNSVALTVLPEDLAAYEAGGAVVTVVNAVEGSPEIAIRTADGTELVPALGYVAAPMAMDDMAATEEAMDEMATEEPMDDMDMGGPALTMGTPASLFVPADFIGAYDIRVVNPADDSEIYAIDGVELLADTAFLIVAYTTDGETTELAIATADLTAITGMDGM
jgi:hypothetical protein